MPRAQQKEFAATALRMSERDIQALPLENRNQILMLRDAVHMPLDEIQRLAPQFRDDLLAKRRLVEDLFQQP